MDERGAQPHRNRRGAGHRDGGGPATSCSRLDLQRAQGGAVWPAAAWHAPGQRAGARPGAGGLPPHPASSHGVPGRGYLIRKRGLGTRVVYPKVRRPLELTSLWDHLELSGKRPRTVVRSLRTVPTTDSVALALDLDEGAEVVAMERLRHADDQPLAVMRNWIPRGLMDLSAEHPERAGLWQLMRAAGIRPHLAWQTIGARRATTAEARLLRAAKGEPVLTMQVTTYNDAGQPLEFGNHIYRAALYSFEIPLVSR
jgi:DNA-binding GntR family transcriptional regulator